MKLAKLITVYLLVGLSSFAIMFAVAKHRQWTGAADRKREECRAAAAVHVESPKYLHVVGSNGNRPDGIGWDLRLRREGDHDVYILVENINPPLLDGRRSVFVEASREEKVFRTRPAEDGKISFKHAISFGKIDGRDHGNGRILFRYPVKGRSKVVQAEGRRTLFGRKTHSGDMEHAVDIAADVGALVVAGRDGVVVHAIDEFPDIGCYVPELEGKSNLVVIRHDDGSEALYAHLMRESVAVPVGTRVRAGDEIARVGNSGMASLPHLHLQVGGLTDSGYMTLPLLFHGCSGGAIRAVARGSFLRLTARQGLN